MSIELRCPETGLGLCEMSLAEAEQVVGPLHSRPGVSFGRTDRVLLREVHAAAYPVVAGVPILMTPEVLTVDPREIDLGDARWAEAYAEIEHYNQAAEDAAKSIDQIADALAHLVPEGAWSPAWLDAPYDAAAQWEALRYLGPPSGKAILQIGGKGAHAVRALLGGAGEVWLVTPMISEAQFALKLMERMGVADRFHAVVGIAEQIPLGDRSFDAIYSGGSLHHMDAAHAGREINRVLKPGGRFAAVEPWQTIFHKYGTGLAGKREKNVHCRPLDRERLALMRGPFGRFTVSQHAPLLRYLALAWLKVSKRSIEPTTGLRLARYDDMLPLPGRWGGSVAVLAERSGASRSGAVAPSTARAVHPG
jgi:SAM-dependent methyltransferase